MSSKAKQLKRAGEEFFWQWKMMEYLSYFLVFLAPLYFIKSSILSSFGAPKTILIIGVTLSMVILYGWGLISSRKLSFRFTPLHIALGVFLIILTVSSIWGVDPHNSFFGRWSEGINLILIYALAIFSLLVGFLVKNNKSFIHRLLWASFSSSIIVAIISYFEFPESQLFKDGVSTIGNNSYTGAYLLFNVCFGLALFLFYLKRNSPEGVAVVKVSGGKYANIKEAQNGSGLWKKIFIVTGVLIILVSPIFLNKDVLLGKIGISSIIHNPLLLLGQANAAVMGVVVSLLVIICFFLIFSSKKVIKIIGVVLFVSLLASIFYTGETLVNPNSSLNKVYIEQKGDNRFIAWDAARKNFYNNPIIGTGFNNYSYAYQKYFTSDILNEKNPEVNFYEPHNVIWGYTSSSGILGLLSYLAILCTIFLALFIGNEYEDKRDQNIRIVIIGLLFGYFVQNLFGFDTPVTFLLLFLIVGFAMGVSKKEWVFSVQESKIDMYKFISSTVIIASLISMILFVFLPYREYKTWGKIYLTNNTKERLQLINQVQKISLFGGAYDSSFLATRFYDSYAKKINEINDTNRDIYLEEIQSIISQVEKDLIKQPDDIYSHIIISQLVNMTIFIKGTADLETWNESYRNVEKAISLNPNNSDTYILLAQVYAFKQDFNNTRLAMRQAIVIAPTYQKSYDYARKLLIIKPDPVFKKFVDNMEKRWGIGL